MFGLQIVFDVKVMRLVPRSDRKVYKAVRPKYGARRKRPLKRMQRTFQGCAWLWRGRRCAPRLIAKPAMFVIGNTLVAHPAMRTEIERVFFKRVH
jgi:hypothetical protein